MKYQPVSIHSDSFLFCRYGVAILLWLAIIFNQTWILLLTFAIFVVSAVMGVNKAPMILFFDSTFGKLRKNRGTAILDTHDIRFVHSLAAIFNGLVLILFYLGFHEASKVVLYIFSILKTASAFGYCPASKLRTCVLGSSGSCCKVSNIFGSKN